jgi:hypothetical protein
MEMTLGDNSIQHPQHPKPTQLSINQRWTGGKRLLGTDITYFTYIKVHTNKRRRKVNLPASTSGHVPSLATIITKNHFPLFFQLVFSAGNHTHTKCNKLSDDVGPSPEMFSLSIQFFVTFLNADQH